jgi:hypothetical protein
MGRLVILSGPSCVGKGPLHRALKVISPQLTSEILILQFGRAAALELESILWLVQVK